MTDHCQFIECHGCGEVLDEATQTIIAREEETTHRPQWNPSIVEDVPVTRYYCEYCGETLVLRDTVKSLLSAAQCARNVLGLLRPEVERLGCRAENVLLKLDFAIIEGSKANGL